jgi:Arc/MetJ-type ribon-helix-helix transcriptional regulator
MSSKRITVSIPDEVAAKAQRAVDAGEVDSVSAYFSRLAEREPDWVAAREAVDEMIAEIGGIPDEARAWARALLDADGAAGAA